MKEDFEPENLNSESNKDPNTLMTRAFDEEKSPLFDVSETSYYDPINNCSRDPVCLSKIMKKELVIANKTFKYFCIPTEKTNILIIQGSVGILSCAYININAANKLNEAVAIVTGVKNSEEMLSANIIEVSNRAKDLGISVGMTGKEALSLLG